MVSRRVIVAAVLLACVAASLVTGISGGLLRAGVAVFDPAATGWLPQAALSHAALMMCSFLGTVIGIERAVASRRMVAWLAPVGSGLAGVALLASYPLAAAALLCGAAAVFVGVNIALWQRQRAPHTALLVVSAVAWLAGNLLFAAGAGAEAVLPWWFAFLIVTIAAERLEMTRLMPRRPGAQAVLYAVLAGVLVGAALSGPWPAAGGAVYGASLVALAAWLFASDIARRTVKAEGLSRYMAVCLLGGYAWLAVGGAAWVAMSQGMPSRDIALHALGLGFIFSMIMGHAPVILPAVTRLKVRYGAVFYVPLVLLHATLAWRLAGGIADMGVRGWGAIGNAIAIAGFAAVVVRGVVGGRRALTPALSRGEREKSVAGSQGESALTPALSQGDRDLSGGGRQRQAGAGKLQG